MGWAATQLVKRPPFIQVAQSPQVHIHARERPKGDDEPKPASAFTINNKPNAAGSADAE